MVDLIRAALGAEEVKSNRQRMRLSDLALGQDERRVALQERQLTSAVEMQQQQVARETAAALLSATRRAPAEQRVGLYRQALQAPDFRSAMTPKMFEALNSAAADPENFSDQRLDFALGRFGVDPASLAPKLTGITEAAGGGFLGVDPAAGRVVPLDAPPGLRTAAAAERDVQARRQTAADARAERADQRADAAAKAETFGSTPVVVDGVSGLVGNRGTFKPVPGLERTASEKPTGEMRQARGYLSRMFSAEEILTGLEKSGFDPVSTGQVLLGLTNVTASTESQQYKQAQEDWVRAKLRKESGAVIGEDEMAREIAVYFPKYGDSAEVIAQRKQSRLEAQKQLGFMAGTEALPGGNRTESNADNVIDWNELQGND